MIFMFSSIYLAIFKTRVKALWQYRAASLAGIFTQLFLGMIQVMIFHSFSNQFSEAEPISLKQAVNFIWIGQAFFQLMPWNLDREIEGQVKSGNISYELIRPLNLYSLWFMRSLATRFVPTFMRSLPIFIIAGSLFDFTAPVSWGAGIAFFLSTIFALLLSASITTAILISLFWSLSGQGIQRLLPPCILFFSGMVVPLPLFPNWMQPFLNIQPFRGLIDIPSGLYNGVIPTSKALYYLGFQLVWAAAFVILGRFLMKKVLRRFAIQGG